MSTAPYSSDMLRFTFLMRASDLRVRSLRDVRSGSFSSVRTSSQGRTRRYRSGKRAPLPGSARNDAGPGREGPSAMAAAVFAAFWRASSVRSSVYA